MDIHQLIVIFCEIDDFCKELEKYTQHRLLSGTKQGKPGPTCFLAISEIMTILVMFQMTGFRNFKTFYRGFLQNYWHIYFPHLPGYPHFVTLMKRAIFPMVLFAQLKGGPPYRHLLY